MNVQERLLQFIAFKKLSKLAFANSIGRSSAYVSNIVTSIGVSTRKKIQETYPELNMNWLLKGEGEMINASPQVTDSSSMCDVDIIPIIPISAQAGSLTEFAEGVVLSDCEKIACPIKDADFAITVTGDSMSPEFPSGSKVIVRKINDKAFIDWGRTYVLDTCNGVVIKNIYPSELVDCVKCVSINPNFPSFEVNCRDIYGWYRVLMSLSLK